MSRTTLGWLGVVSLLFLAFAIRIYQLDSVPLRGDEAFTAIHWVGTPLTEDWVDLVKTEAHPVGAFFLYWSWQGIAGDSEFAMRLLPLLFNVIGMAAVMVMARRWFRDWRLVMMVGMIWALNPFLVWHAQDVRNYSMVTAMAPLAFYWLVRALDHPRALQSLRPWWPYIIIQTFAVYIYFFEAFTLAAQILFVMIAYRRHMWKQAVQAWMVMVALSVPVAVQVYWLRVVGGYEGTAIEASLSVLFERFVPTLLFGENAVPLAVGVVLVASITIGLLSVAWRGYQWAWLLLVWAMLPLVLIFIVSHGTSVFRPRYIIHAVPALILGMVAIASIIGKPLRLGLLLPLLVTVVVCGTSTVEIYDYFVNDPSKSPDWRGLSAYLEVRTTSYDTVLAGEPDPALEYYYRGPGTVNYIPVEEVDPDIAFGRLLVDYDAVYMLAGARTGDAGRYLQANGQHIPGDTYDGVVQYRPYQVRAREIQYDLDVRFGDVARLRGYTILGSEILLLYWEPVGTTNEEHSVMVHILPAGGETPVTVLDHGVAGSMVSMTSWPIGEIVRDPVGLQLPSGEYEIKIGIYKTPLPDESASEIEFLQVNGHDTSYIIGPLQLGVE